MEFYFIFHVTRVLPLLTLVAANSILITLSFDIFIQKSITHDNNGKNKKRRMDKKIPPPAIIDCDMRYLLQTNFNIFLEYPSEISFYSGVYLEMLSIQFVNMQTKNGLIVTIILNKSTV